MCIYSLKSKYKMCQNIKNSQFIRYFWSLMHLKSDSHLPKTAFVYVSKIQHQKYFPSKTMQKMRQRDQLQTIFSFLKKLYIMYKQEVSTFVLIHFGRPCFKHAVKTNFVIFETADPEICPISIFYKRVREQLLQSERF